MHQLPAVLASGSNAPAAVTVTLEPPGDPRVARALTLLTGEINTQPPSIPGDTRPITYRITPQPAI